MILLKERIGKMLEYLKEQVYHVQAQCAGEEYTFL